MFLSTDHSIAHRNVEVSADYMPINAKKVLRKNSKILAILIRKIGILQYKV